MAKEIEKDFDKSPATVKSSQDEIRAFMARYNTNKVQIAGTVRSVYVSEAKPKIDKKTNLPIEVDGIPQFWEPFRSVTIAFEGGEMDINLDKKQFDAIEIGERYLFEGVKGLNYGKVQDMFHNIVKIS